MKVLQLNIWQGNILGKLIKFVEEINPDIICAQEAFDCDTRVPIMPNLSIGKRLSDLYPYVYFSATHTLTIYGQKVSYGNAIYSKFEITESETIFTHGEKQEDDSTNDIWYNVRCVQRVLIDAPVGEIAVFNHHGYHDLDSAGNEKTVESHAKAAAYIKDTMKRNTIVCGDFNTNPEAAAMNAFHALDLRNLTVEHNVKTTLSDLQYVDFPVVCDYILCSPELDVISFEAKNALVSDHCALIAEVSP